MAATALTTDMYRKSKKKIEAKRSWMLFGGKYKKRYHEGNGSGKKIR